MKLPPAVIRALDEEYRRYLEERYPGSIWMPSNGHGLGSGLGRAPGSRKVTRRPVSRDDLGAIRDRLTPNVGTPDEHDSD